MKPDERNPLDPERTGTEADRWGNLPPIRAKEVNEAIKKEVPEEYREWIRRWMDSLGK